MQPTGRGSLPARVLAGVILVSLGLSRADGADPSFTVGPGFSIARVAGAPQIVFPMFAARAADGAVFVTESSGLDLYAELQKQTRRCRISRLEDRDGDGSFERAQVFADGLVFPMGLAWREGRLYAADPPDVIVLADRDGDGRADERKVLLTGFGHTDNGSLHGLIFGPDGWLYMTTGQPDGYRIKSSDGTWLEGKSGALLRCRVDGSGFEVVARGFENLVEIDFMPSGEIIGTDNWFFRPEAGQRDALVHLVEGGLYPLNAHARFERNQFQSGRLLPSITVFPAVALSGLMRYRGDQFPERLRDAFFSAQFNARKIAVHHLRRQGATFRSEDEDFLTTDAPDFHPSDVLEDKDGSLLVIDTGAWYVQHCPTGRIRPAPSQGGIYRVSYNARADQPPRTTARDESLARTVAPDPTPLAIETDLRGLTSADPEMVTGVAVRLRRRGDKSAEQVLVRLLSRPESSVRRAAAEALAHCGSSNALPALIRALATENDPFLEHSLVFACFRLADGPALAAMLEHPHPRVQQAALILLEQAPHRSLDGRTVLRYVGANDERLRHTALSILQQHPDWSREAASFVHDAISQKLPSGGRADDETVRALVVAFQNERAVQTDVANAIGNANLPVEARAVLLDAISCSSLAPLPESWIGAIVHALQGNDPRVCLQAIRAVEMRRIKTLDGTLADLTTRTNVPVEVRLNALRALLPRQPQLNATSYELLLTQIQPTASPATRLAAAELLGRSRWADAQGDPARLVAVIREDRLISPSTLLPLLLQSHGENFEAVATYLVESIDHGWRPRDNEVQAIQKRLAAATSAKLMALTSRLSQEAATSKTQREQLDALAELLSGGDAQRGRRWFSEKAGCIACHRVAATGGTLGPDLTRIGAIRSGRDLLESILFPSASFAQGYETFTIKGPDGDELTGVRVPQDDDSFVLREASGREVQLQPAQRQTMERSKISLMPEGLLSALTREEIRDLLAYVQSLK